ncbi:MAG: alanine--tRNA ligase-related protein, partial [Candidatus Pacebacteria bacterium]|nr:alanine--tRNA ligase-related protein [Candidatus Paceibacterota bacterium]
MKSSEIRQRFLDYYRKKNHVVINSASLVPENDSSTLFVSSGMQPLVPYLLGEPHPGGKRICNSQKAFRAEDIEEIGDNRHNTFFEMLGNWSLGDYFKNEQLAWVFEFLTKDLGIDPNRLYVTCFRGNKEIEKDAESALIWERLFKEKRIEAKQVDFPEKNGMQQGRIFFYNETKNWWSRSGIPFNMPVGEPGGPDSEIFYDTQTNKHENSKWKNLPCHLNCDCGR